MCDVTYEDVAASLWPEIREAIEISMPCLRSADKQHLWDHERYQVETFGGGVVRVDEWWRCVHCYAISHLDPVPAEMRPGRLPAAFARELQEWLSAS